MLELQSLCKSYDDRLIFSNINFTVSDGETVCILGPSGCGKTTLLHTLIGLEQADSGTFKTQSYNIGVLFQERDLLPWRTVLDNAALGLEFKGIHKKDAREQAQACLGALDLFEAVELYPHQISGGMKRRVSLAQVLAPQPDILFLDEPLTGLDVTGRRMVSQVIKTYTKEQKASAVIVTHSIEEAIFLADRILIFSNNPATIFTDIDVKNIKHKNVFKHILDVFMQANPRSEHVDVA